MSEGLAISYTRNVHVKTSCSLVLVPALQLHQYDLSKRSWENNKGSAFRVGISRRRGIRRDLVGSGDGREGATISDSIVVIGDE